MTFEFCHLNLNVPLKFEIGTWEFRTMKTRNNNGYALPFILMLAAVFLIFAAVVLGRSAYNQFQSKSVVDRVKALNLAEAGINYYMWHLSHNNTDYQDDTAQPANPPFGPYLHQYTDSSSNTIGTFTLTIDPPTQGGNAVTVTSIGQPQNSSAIKTLQAQIGIPSFSGYVFVSATEAWFGETEETTGKVLSNIGVHYDGVANGPVMAANATYTPSPEFGGDGEVHPGVWGTGGPQSYFQYPVPPVNFQQITADLKIIEDAAIAQGLRLGASGQLGYSVNLNAANMTISKVTRERANGITTSSPHSYDYPQNGVLFIADNVWVSGTLGPSRKLTIASARLPDVSSTNTTIKIGGSVHYTQNDGTNVLGLIAQKDIIVPQYAPTNLKIDASLLAQKGHVYQPYYGKVFNSVEVYGSIATFDFWTWSWVDGYGHTVSGFQNTSLIYDEHLTLSPPPFYPKTGNYQILNWREQ